MSGDDVADVPPTILCFIFDLFSFMDVMNSVAFSFGNTKSLRLRGRPTASLDVVIDSAYYAFNNADESRLQKYFYLLVIILYSYQLPYILRKLVSTISTLLLKVTGSGTVLVTGCLSNLTTRNYGKYLPNDWTSRMIGRTHKSDW